MGCGIFTLGFGHAPETTFHHVRQELEKLELLHVIIQTLKMKYIEINWLSLLETVCSRMLMDTYSQDL